MKTKLDNMFTNDFIRIPRPFIRKFSLNTAVMLSEIYSEYTYWRDRNELQPGGWFYSTVDNMYNNTGLSKHQQLVACKTLEDYGIIKIKHYGMPQKRYFKFDMTKLNKLYSDFELNSNQTIDYEEPEDFHDVDITKYQRPFTGYSF